MENISSIKRQTNLYMFNSLNKLEKKRFDVVFIDLYKSKESKGICDYFAIYKTQEEKGGSKEMRELIRKILYKLGYDISRKTNPKMPYSLALELLYFKEMLDKAPKGDIVECGVAKGRTFLLLAYLASLSNRRIWGFDSFEGYPEFSEIDKSSGEGKGDSAAGIKTVYELIKNSGLSQDFIRTNLMLSKGFFNESLRRYEGEIALLHMDVNLYESYRTVFRELYSKVVPGGVIMFGEYREIVSLLSWPGAEKAIEEFIDPKKILRHNLRGKYYYIKNKD